MYILVDHFSHKAFFGRLPKNHHTKSNKKSKFLPNCNVRGLKKNAQKKSPLRTKKHAQRGEREKRVFFWKKPNFAYGLLNPKP